MILYRVTSKHGSKCCGKTFTLVITYKKKKNVNTSPLIHFLRNKHLSNSRFLYLRVACNSPLGNDSLLELVGKLIKSLFALLLLFMFSIRSTRNTSTSFTTLFRSLTLLRRDSIFCFNKPIIWKDENKLILSCQQNLNNLLENWTRYLKQWFDTRLKN